MRIPTRGRIGRSRILVASLTLTALLTTLAPTVVFADAWAGSRNCNQFETCRVKSYATGSVEHERCTTAYTNCVVKGSWANGGSYIWRTSFHGSGNQGVVISTTGDLTSQYAECICLSPPCPE